MWKSKQQTIIETSSTEAEYIALSELTKELMFLIKIFEFINIRVKFPITINIDNIGALYIATNNTTKSTKHFDVRYLMVNEKVELGIIKLKKVKSSDNAADIFTKNTNKDLYKKHISKYLVDMSPRPREDVEIKENVVLEHKQPTFRHFNSDDNPVDIRCNFDTQRTSNTYKMSGID